MSRGIRWVQAKAASLGQASLATGPGTIPAEVPQGAPTDTKAIYERVILGGFILAGATLVLTLAFGGSHK